MLAASEIQELLVYIKSMVPFLTLNEVQMLELLKLVPKSNRQHKQLVVELLTMYVLVARAVAAPAGMRTDHAIRGMRLCFGCVVTPG